MGRKFRACNIKTASGLKRKANKLGKAIFNKWMKKDIHITNHLSNKIYKSFGIAPIPKQKAKCKQLSSINIKNKNNLIENKKEIEIVSENIDVASNSTIKIDKSVDPKQIIADNLCLSKNINNFEPTEKIKNYNETPTGIDLMIMLAGKLKKTKRINNCSAI